VLTNSETVLRQLVERVENLNEQKDEITEDIKNVYTEAKLTGFNPKVLRKLVALRKVDPEIRKEEHSLLSLYAKATDTDLGEDLVE